MEWLLIVTGVLFCVDSYALIHRAQRKSAVAGPPGTEGSENINVPAWYRYLGWVGGLLVIAGVIWLFV